MEFIIHNWLSLIFLLGSFGFGAIQGYYDHKMQPAILIVFMFLLFSGFGFGSAIKGIVDVFTATP